MKGPKYLDGDLIGKGPYSGRLVAVTHTGVVVKPATGPRKEWSFREIEWRQPADATQRQYEPPMVAGRILVAVATNRRGALPSDQWAAFEAQMQKLVEQWSAAAAPERPALVPLEPTTTALAAQAPPAKETPMASEAPTASTPTTSTATSTTTPKWKQAPSPSEVEQGVLF